jgi:hypothetical protein
MNSALVAGVTVILLVGGMMEASGQRRQLGPLPDERFLLQPGTNPQNQRRALRKVKVRITHSHSVATPRVSSKLAVIRKVRAIREGRARPVIALPSRGERIARAGYGASRGSYGPRARVALRGERAVVRRYNQATTWPRPLIYRNDAYRNYIPLGAAQPIVSNRQLRDGRFYTPTRARTRYSMAQERRRNTPSRSVLNRPRTFSALNAY